MSIVAELSWEDSLDGKTLAASQHQADAQSGGLAALACTPNWRLSREL